MSGTRIHVDRATCVGYGMCESLSDYFEVEDGSVVIRSETPAAGDLDEVEAAVDACPVLALSLVAP
jgi:ferredoxin